jgi:16S rRNA U516 pseudouridylate synthase RsuA-like enzyme
MMASQGCEVTRLHRASFGALGLAGLAVGDVRVLSAEEVELLGG